MRAATPQAATIRSGAIRTRRLEWRLTFLASRLARITSELATAQEALRQANNHNVGVIDLATHNTNVLHNATLDLLGRIEVLEAWKADSIFGHGD